MIENYFCVPYWLIPILFILLGLCSFALYRLGDVKRGETK